MWEQCGAMAGLSLCPRSGSTLHTAMWALAEMEASCSCLPSLHVAGHKEGLGSLCRHPWLSLALGSAQAPVLTAQSRRRLGHLSRLRA